MITLPVIPWLIAVGLLSLFPDFRCSHDKRQFDGERYTEICGGRYQQPETWACIEVPR